MYYDHCFAQFFSILLKYIGDFFAYRFQMVYEAGKMLISRKRWDEWNGIYHSWLRLHHTRPCTPLYLDVKTGMFCCPTSHWHTCKFHLLGMRPQIATHKNNPRTLSWTFMIFERQSIRGGSQGSWQTNRSPSGRSTRYNIQKWFAALFSQIWFSMCQGPTGHLTALQEQQLEQEGINRGAVPQFWREPQQTTSGARTHIN